MRSRGAALRAEEPVSPPPDFAKQLAAEAAAKVGSGSASSGEATVGGTPEAAMKTATPELATTTASGTPDEVAMSGPMQPAAPQVEAAPVRPGETYQDYVLHSEEDAGEDGTEIRPERVFVPGAREAIRLRPGSSELYLMTQLRDEAHRFAITHHRKRRGKRALHSVLDDVPGVGPALKKALLQAFGSVAAIAAADDAALTAIKGVGPALARKIREAVGGA
jgi:excinuclease ABC subunit C